VIPTVSSPRRPLRLAFALGVLVLGHGCAAARPALPGPPGEAVVRGLEEAHARSPDHAPTLVSLGHAYQLQGRPADAALLLERAVALRPDDADAALLLGLVYEDLERYDEAAERYRAYIASGLNRGVRRQLSDRLVLLRRRQLASAARDALGREAELAGTAPQPGTVAVFPFLLQAADPDLRPLGLALADLLVTDLSQTDRLRVVDRLQVQALLDEVRLAETGLVDPATAARGGRLLGAGRIVQGSIGGSEAELQLRAAVVGVGGDWDGRVLPVEERDPLRRLFEMEKRLALEIYRSLGVELTAAERERVMRRPTANVRALLAYGFGLEAENAGEYRRARELHAAAVALDPGFAAAREREAEAARLAEAEVVTTQQLGLRAILEDPYAHLAEAEALVPGAGGRDALSELLGNDAIGPSGAVVRIILRR
jgi:tetratricopeptide (TPR) repeat protein